MDHNTVVYFLTNFSNYMNLPLHSRTEPPMKMKLLAEQLEEAKTSHALVILLEKFPCHTQAVERCVKLVTKASLSVCGHKNRDGMIRVKLLSQKNIPQFEKKSDYNVQQKYKIQFKFKLINFCSIIVNNIQIIAPPQLCFLNLYPRQLLG